MSHIEQDEQIKLNKISHEFLSDNIIDKNEMVEIVNDIFNQFNANKEIIVDDINIVSCPSREKVENIASNTPWISWSGIFGLFRAQKESIISDIDKLIENHSSFDFEELIVESFQTSTISGIITDPSQEEIINSLTKSKHRVIQGPPGTGKSQSLTAIIINCLENNAKALIVCEKKTALDVIYKNLSELGFNKYCTIIDDVNRDRKKLLIMCGTKQMN